MLLYSIPDLSEGWLMLIIGMGVTFTVLILLFLSFSQLQHLVNFINKKDEPKSEKSSPSEKNKSSNKELTGDINAAISMALYFYLNDQHDHESEVVTIKTMQRRYSPWSSKIYGLNNIIKK